MILALKVVMILGRKEVFGPLADRQAWLSLRGEESQSLQLKLTKGAPLRPQQDGLFIFTGDTSDGDHYLVCADVADKKK